MVVAGRGSRPPDHSPSQLQLAPALQELLRVGIFADNLRWFSTLRAGCSSRRQTNGVNAAKRFIVLCLYLKTFPEKMPSTLTREGTPPYTPSLVANIRPTSPRFLQTRLGATVFLLSILCLL